MLRPSFPAPLRHRPGNALNGVPHRAKCRQLSRDDNARPPPFWPRTPKPPRAAAAPPRRPHPPRSDDTRPRHWLESRRSVFRGPGDRSSTQLRAQSAESAGGLAEVRHATAVPAMPSSVPALSVWACLQVGRPPAAQATSLPRADCLRNPNEKTRQPEWGRNAVSTAGGGRGARGSVPPPKRSRPRNADVGDRGQHPRSQGVAFAPGHRGGVDSEAPSL